MSVLCCVHGYVAVIVTTTVAASQKTKLKYCFSLILLLITLNHLSVELSLNKTPHPHCSWLAGCPIAWLTLLSVCECVHEWVNVRQYCKVL